MLLRQAHRRLYKLQRAFVANENYLNKLEYQYVQKADKEKYTVAQKAVLTVNSSCSQQKLF